jgi:hypothetical protein
MFIIKRIIKCFFFVLLFLFVFSCATIKPDKQVTVPKDFFGIVHAARTQKTEENKLLEQMEVKWVLNTFYWNSIEREKGFFNFSSYDLFVNDAKKQGLKIVAVLGYSNRSYSKGKSIYYISPENIPFFLRYVEEIVTRYKGKVDVWNVWNEPNIKFWQGSRKEYFELTKLVTKKIRETDPNAYIIGGAFCRSPTGFIKSMHKAGAMEGLDALAFHPYDLNPSGSMRIYDSFAKTLSEINYTGPIWVTEVGFPTGGWYPNKVSLKKYPTYIVKTITAAAARGPRVLLWYHMFDSLDSGKKSLDSEDYFGLVNKDFTRKAGSYAYELCARFLPGSRYVPELPERKNIPSNIVSFCFLDDTSGNNTLILWNDRKSNQQIELNLQAPAMLHDISTGQNTALPTDMTLDITNKPLIITWQGSAIPHISRKR